MSPSSDASPNPADPATYFPPEEFAARRQALMARLEPDAAVVLQGAGPVRAFELFRQTNELFYLAGVELPRAHLLLHGRDGSATLFIPPRDPGAAAEGEVLGAEDADLLTARHGLDAVRPLEDLAQALAPAQLLYTPFSPAQGRAAARDTLAHAARLADEDPWDGAPSREERFISLLRDRCPSADTRDLTPALDNLRLVKSPRELAVLRRAGALAALAVAEAMRLTRPGLREYELGAVADHVFLANGARGGGYRAIIAGGVNIWHAHYFRDDALLRDGALVPMDYAPEVAYYTSDITRVWPVGGRFSPVQRELHSFITEYHKALLRRLGPGVLPRELLADAAGEMRGVLDAWGWSKPEYEAAARRALDFAGHLSHPVGMAVHDVGSYFDRPMEPGLVFALDPQMWVPEERLYVRVEDTVAITEDGVEVLTAGAPLELDEIEAVVGRGGSVGRPPRCDVGLG